MDRLKHGQRRAMRLRRIDEHRAVVLPEQTASVVDVRRLRHQLERAQREAEVAKHNLDDATARIQVLQGYIATFAQSPIVGDDDDPVDPREPAPAPEPVPEPTPPES